jgi:hypothetical protein
MVALRVGALALCLALAHTNAACADGGVAAAQDLLARVLGQLAPLTLIHRLAWLLPFPPTSPSPSLPLHPPLGNTAGQFIRFSQIADCGSLPCFTVANLPVRAR